MEGAGSGALGADPPTHAVSKRVKVTNTEFKIIFFNIISLNRNVPDYGVPYPEH